MQPKKTSVGRRPASFERNLLTDPYVDPRGGIPGFGTRPLRAGGPQTKWLGGDGDAGPWIYCTERVAGDVVKPHKHQANRIEILLEGSIDWYEGDDALRWLREPANPPTPRRYERGSLTYVEAGTVYGYTVVTDARILLWFEDHPRGTAWAAEHPDAATDHADAATDRPVAPD